MKTTYLFFIEFFSMFAILVTFILVSVFSLILIGTLFIYIKDIFKPKKQI